MLLTYIQLNHTEFCYTFFSEIHMACKRKLEKIHNVFVRILLYHNDITRHLLLSSSTCIKEVLFIVIAISFPTENNLPHMSLL